MTTESIPPNIVIHSPLDVVSSVPYLLGFQPGESIVTVFFNDEASYVVAARIDLRRGPAGQRYPASYDSVNDYLCAGIDRCVRSAIDAGATGVQLIAYLPEPPHLILEYLDTVTRLISAFDLPVMARGWVDQGRWFDAEKWLSLAVHDDLGEVIDTASEAACSWIVQGSGYLKDRDSLWEIIRGAPTELANDIAAKHRSGDHDWYQYAGSWRVRRKIENHLFAYVTSAVVDRLELDEYATWLLGLWDRRVREPLLWRLATYLAHGETPTEDAHRAMDRLCFLVRNAPPTLISPIASVAAAFAWQIGNGALSTTIAEHGLNDNPNNVLCGLVWQAVCQGVHPNEWTTPLCAMTLRQLRGTHTKIRAS